MHAAAQFHALQPVQDEQRALDPPQLAQGDSQTVLARVATQFTEHQRGRHGALLDREVATACRLDRPRCASRVLIWDSGTCKATWPVPGSGMTPVCQGGSIQWSGMVGVCVKYSSKK